MKMCSICGQEKPFTEYYRNRARPDGFMYRCKPCAAAYQAAFFARKRDFVQSLKSKPCHDCGISYPYYVMQFDHVGKKSINLNQRGRHASIGRLKAEVAKCEVVCANCHAERTYQRQQAVRRSPGWGYQRKGSAIVVMGEI